MRERAMTSPSDAKPDTPVPPRPTVAFEWSSSPAGLVLQASALRALTGNHGFTTRHPPLPEGAPTCRSEWSGLARHAGVAEAQIVRLVQVHGSAVIDASAGDASGRRADAVVADRRDLVLTVKVADCVPILLADPHSGAVAAVHAGWRGTAAGIGRRAVEVMQERFGATPHALVAAIGPSIGPCCYTVGHEVEDAFLSNAAERGGDRWFQRGTSLRLDLWGANRDQLVAAGLEPARVHVARLCTACHSAVFHSYRRDGARAGRQLGFIRPRTRP
jgi:polyphenol oxidase